MIRYAAIFCIMTVVRHTSACSLGALEKSKADYFMLPGCTKEVNATHRTLLVIISLLCPATSTPLAVGAASGCRQMLLSSCCQSQLCHSHKHQLWTRPMPCQQPYQCQQSHTLGMCFQQQGCGAQQMRA
jgi:hypothetical protein